MNHANKPRAKLADSSNVRVAFKDVSNHFSVECSKKAKAVKTHKRNIESIYSAAYSPSKPANTEKSGLSLAKSVEAGKAPVAAAKPIAPLRANSESSESNLPAPAKSTIALRAAASYRGGPGPPANPTLASRTSSYQDGPFVDIDKRDADDPLCVTSYVQDMYQHYREQEHRAVVGDYMGGQQSVNERMRAILIDWLCSIHHKMKCDPETLFLTVNIIDRYLAKKNTSRKKLQLLGVGALLIASKYEQIYPAEVKDLVYVCDGLYTKIEIIDMETQMLQTLNYQISIPTIYKFFVRYLNVGRADRKIIFLSSYVLEESLRSYGILKYKPSQLAAAAVLIGRHTVGRNKWSPTLLKYSEYREEDILPVARAMLAAKNSVPPGLVSSKNKFSRSSKFNAAHISLPSDI